MRGKRTKTLWGVWAIKPDPITKRLHQAVPCSFAHCEQEAYWTYKGSPICDEHLIDSSNIDDDMAREILPALKEIAVLQHRKMCSICKIHISEDDFYGDPCVVNGKPACHPCQYIHDEEMSA